MTTLPAPFISADVDLREFDFMPLYGKRLFTSETWILCDAEEKVAALRLWWAAWHEEPAGSLPNNDRMLADLAGYGVALKAFLSVKANAMRGWIECSDGRLYHPIVCEIAEESWDGKKKKRADNERDRARKEAKRRIIPTEIVPLSAGQTTEHHIMSAGIPPENALKGREEEGKEKRRDINIQSSGSSESMPDTARDASPPQAASPGSHPRYPEVRQKVEDLLANPNLLVFGRIDAWLKSGADPEMDIYPTLERTKARWKGSNLNFFDGAIADALASRTAPLAPGTASPRSTDFDLKAFLQSKKVAS